MRRQLPIVTIRYNIQHTTGAVYILCNIMGLLLYNFWSSKFEFLWFSIIDTILVFLVEREGDLNLSADGKIYVIK